MNEKFIVVLSAEIMISDYSSDYEKERTQTRVVAVKKRTMD